ncbi:type II secretion system F family protein, partial [Saccharomonospora iraqiensis]|uniref:type II secretion system F family protein n=1 Tax=Saccharomonospora iraqiensis TaxID=52698 RepID=UPI00389A50BF
GRLAVRRLSVAWSLADEHGIPLADLLDVVRRDLDATVRSAGRTEAGMAGPRTSAGVLALLPAVGIALGEATGAAPLAVLTGTGLGAVLLLVGTGLVLAGVLWTSALTGRVMPR